jgi:hypothetical protein
LQDKGALGGVRTVGISVSLKHHLKVDCPARPLTASYTSERRAGRTR